MYLHFEDWSNQLFLNQLKAKGIPHGEKIIKVFASVDDPRIILRKPDLVALEISGKPFPKDEIFDYGERGKYSGKMLEEKLLGINLSDFGKEVIRSLFRFANQEGFTQTAMEIMIDGNWLIEHPLGDIDGIDIAKRYSDREKAIHLDIFLPQSLEHLREILDFTNPEKIANMLEGQRSRTKKEGLSQEREKNGKEN